MNALITYVIIEFGLILIGVVSWIAVVVGVLSARSITGQIPSFAFWLIPLTLMLVYSMCFTVPEAISHLQYVLGLAGEGAVL